MILEHPLTSTNSSSSVEDDDDDADFAAATFRRKKATPKSVTRGAPRQEKDVKRRQSTFHRVISARTKSVAEEALTKEIRRGTEEEEEEEEEEVLLSLGFFPASSITERRR